MTTSPKIQNKRVFIASARNDLKEFRRAMRDLKLDGITLDEWATPGSAWVDNLHRCVNAVDLVVGIIGESRMDSDVFFELGVASGLNKPTVAFIAPDFSFDMAPPAGIPFLRINPRDQEAVSFGLKQVLSMTPRATGRLPVDQVRTRPIGEAADGYLERLGKVAPGEREDLIYDVLSATGAMSIARGVSKDMGVDFAVWSNDLEPAINNPLLIECKSSLKREADVNEAFGGMFRAVQPIRNGWGIVLYMDRGSIPIPFNPTSPVIFVPAADFISSLRDTGLAEYAVRLRNTAAHGL